MKVKLKVLKGGNAGKEIKIPTPKCLVGRGDECHLRPKSDAISRRHCEIYIQDGKVLIRDLESKNGTYVNSDRISEERVLKTGDKVQFGPLSFEIVIDLSLGGEKKPKVNSIKEAAARKSAVGKDAGPVEDSKVSDWLEEADDVEEESRIDDPETRQLKLDDTDQVTVQKTLENQARRRKEQGLQDDTADVAPEKKIPDKKKKKGFQKLPQQPDTGTANSRDAAAQMLRKFFNKR